MKGQLETAVREHSLLEPGIHFWSIRVVLRRFGACLDPRGMFWDAFLDYVRVFRPLSADPP